MLIGLHGKSRSGKDTSYQFIRAYGGEWVRREGFADRLKLSAARALGFKGPLDEAVAFCNDLKQPGMILDLIHESIDGETQIASVTGREYLQFYGTEAHREVFDPDFWINAVMTTYDPDEVLIITDVRFPNEAEAIRAAGGEVWHIVRLGHEGIAESAHASEQVLPPELIDRTIFNDTDLEGLQEKVVVAYRHACQSIGFEELTASAAEVPA